MKQLEIKDNVLIIDDGQKCFNIELGAIDIACTDGFVINLKLFDGRQAFLHPENKESREEFNALVELLTKYANFYQCDGNMVINLETLQEASIDQEKTHWGYYNLDMIFERMKGGLASRNLEDLRKTKEEILQAKLSYEETKNIALN